MSFGILQFFILQGVDVNLDKGRDYYVVATPPSFCTKSGPIRTPKKSQAGLEWNHTEEIILTGALAADANISLALMQTTPILADKRVGSVDVNLQPLLAGSSINDTEFSFRGSSGEEVARVSVRISWKGEMPAYAGAAAGSDLTANAGAHAAGVAASKVVVPLPPPQGLDFSVRIRVHKARNLQSLAEDKLYNPRVAMSVCGKTNRTETIKNTNEPIWDEEIIFTLNSVKETFWTEILSITVLNSRLAFNETIGVAEIDLGSVYRSSATHSMPRKWFVLKKSPTEGNVMGFIKVSLCVLNLRTDSFPQDDDVSAEDENEESVINSLMSAPGAVFEELTLCCDIVKAIGLPVMDAGINGTADPYVKITFGKRSVNTVNIRNTLAPTWNTQVTLPLLLPSLTDTIRIQLWDWDATSADDLIGTVFLRLAELIAAGGDSGLPTLPVQWINFYGHPRACDADFNRYFKAMARGERKGIDFRGRLLLRMMGFRGRERPPPPVIRESIVDICVVVQLMQFGMMRSSGRYKVRISMGAWSCTSKTHNAEQMRGSKDLYSIYFGEEINFVARFHIIPPEVESDAGIIEQLPDLIVQLIEESALSTIGSAIGLTGQTFTGRESEAEPYASCRFPTASILGQRELFYKCKPLRLSKDPTTLSEGSAPSNPLAQLVCSMYIKDCQPQHQNVPIMTEPVSGLPRFLTDAPLEKHMLLCYVYMAKQFPPGDSNGLSDPYIRVTWANSTGKSGTKLGTLNPSYFETIGLVADTKARFSDVVVEIWDWDLIGSDTFLCKTVIPYDDVASCGIKPQWYKHFTTTYGDRAHGCELLLGFEVMKATSEALSSLPGKQVFFQKGSATSRMPSKSEDTIEVIDAWFGTERTHISNCANGMRIADHIKAHAEGTEVRIPAFQLGFFGGTDPAPGVHKYTQMVIKYRGKSFNVRAEEGRALAWSPPSEQPSGSGGTYMAIPIPRNRLLIMAKYAITCTLFGLRQMRKFHLREIQKPSVDITIGDFHVTFGKRVGVNADFNLQAQLVLELPDESDYLPHINFLVYDHRIGPKVLVGSASIPLHSDRCNPAAKQKQRAIEDQRVADNLKLIAQAKHRMFGSGTEAEPPAASAIALGDRAGGKVAHFRKTEASPAHLESAIGEAPGDLHQPLLINSELELGSKEGSEASKTPPESQAPKTAIGTTGGKVTADDINRAFNDMIQHDILEGAQRSASPTPSEASTEPEDELWFDRFDPDGLGVSIEPERIVSRLGSLNVLPAGNSTAEDYFGPFDDGIENVALHRGWGKDKSKSGNALVDMSLSKTDPSMEVTSTPRILPLLGRKPQSFVLRVYILQCRNLAPMDDSPLGKASDPYVILRLTGGGNKSSDVTLKCKDEGQFQTLDPDFFFMKEMRGSLPEHSRLLITVMDYDKIGFDEEIGSSEIMLEERWFSQRGYQARRGTTLLPGSYTEVRSLRNQMGLLQGTMELWVDMFDSSAPTIPRPIDVTPPPPTELELRVVVWNARDVELVDTNIHGEAMVDMYVRCWLDGMRHDVQNTDVHYRSLDGSGNFNWRMVFPLVFEPRSKRIYPPNSKSNIASFFHVRKEQKKFEPMLHLQIFDNDLLPGTDDFVGETNINLLGALPTTTHRKKETLLGAVASDVKSILCCNFWPFNICCPKRGAGRELTLEEKRQLALEEARVERTAQEAQWRESADKKIAALRQSKKFTEEQLVKMHKALVKEAKRAMTINLFDKFLPQRPKKGSGTAPRAASSPSESDAAQQQLAASKEVPKQVESAKYWFACRGPFGGGRVGDVQVSFSLVRKNALDEDSNLAAGKGRSEPNALPEPNRPDSSFFWLSSPWKAAVHILWKNYKWYFFTILCIVISAVAIYLFFSEGLKVKAQGFFS